jgi:hypothetical protein
MNDPHFLLLISVHGVWFIVTIVFLRYGDALRGENRMMVMGWDKVGKDTGIGIGC